MKQQLFVLFLLFSLLGIAQHQDKVDFIRGEVIIKPIPEDRQIKGTVTYGFYVLKDVDSVFLDAKNMEFSSVSLNGKKIKYLNNGEIVSIKNRFREGENYKLKLEYSCIPKQTVYFLGWDTLASPGAQGLSAERSRGQIWTQGQGKYTSYWLPSVDDMEEKIEFDLNITTGEGYQVVANGNLISTSDEEADLKTWHFDMHNPMSSYLLAFAIGEYMKKKLISKSGIPIENFFYPQDSLRVEPTYRYTKEIFDFLENEIGVPYPWQNYKQVPVRDFLYAGMENTSATIFSDQYVIDSTAFIDKNYVNVNAHEMAHQWFGDLVTEKDGKHHWLHEGFATYYAYLAEKEIFGDDYFYWKIYDTASELHNISEEGKGEALTNPKSGSLTFYEKGAWALLALHDEIGEASFKIGIKSYLQKFQYRSVTISDFINEMERASGKDLSGFNKEWLNGTQFSFENAKKILTKHSRSVANLFKMQIELAENTEDSLSIIQKYWDNTTSEALKIKIISDYHSSLPSDFMHRALESGNLKIRQTVALLGGDYAGELKRNFESLLGDDSYLTKESALYQLWAGFPADRAKYLNQTKGIIGFPNKNIRLLWLTLAVLTDNYETRNTKQYFDELGGYTSPAYSYEVRQGAFQFLNEAFGFTDQNLLDLIQATMHHSWQFRKYARALLDQLLTDEIYKERITGLVDKLIPEEKRYIESKLNKI